MRIGNILYDPSYGVTYGANLNNPTNNDLLAAFETAALSGYAHYYAFNEVAANNDINQDGVLSNNLPIIVFWQPGAGMLGQSTGAASQRLEFVNW